MKPLDNDTLYVKRAAGHPWDTTLNALIRNLYVTQSVVSTHLLQINVLTHLPPRKMAAILADDIFHCIFLNETDGIPVQISPKYVPKSPIENKPVLVRIIA